MSFSLGLRWKFMDSFIGMVVIALLKRKGPFTKSSLTRIWEQVSIYSRIHSPSLRDSNFNRNVDMLYPGDFFGSIDALLHERPHRDEISLSFIWALSLSGSCANPPPPNGYWFLTDELGYFCHVGRPWSNCHYVTMTFAFEKGLLLIKSNLISIEFAEGIIKLQWLLIQLDTMSNIISL